MSRGAIERGTLKSITFFLNVFFLKPTDSGTVSSTICMRSNLFAVGCVIYSAINFSVPVCGIFIERELFQSDAFLSLGKNSIKVLFALLDNREREPQSQAKDKKGNKRKARFINLDSLEIPYGRLEKVYKISRSNIPVAIDELLAKGFIKISYHGGACKHDKTTYAWLDNYLLWTKHSTPFEIRPKRERHGYQGRRIGATAK